MIKWRLTAAVLLLAATPAAADPVEITAQARSARAEFLRTATPPGPAATICIVDTGADSNPDTAGVIGRLSISGEVSDQSPTLHGTTTAMFIGGSSNNWGMVGLWPAARVLSVRSNVPTRDEFTPTGIADGMKRCDEASRAYGVKVVAVPFAIQAPLTPDEAQAFREEIDAAHARGANVVAAGGNTFGGPMAAPANMAGVLAVGAGNTTTGSVCPFGALGARLLAPGCGLDGADPRTGAPLTTQQGTSHATAIVAAALSALRTWRPDLSWADAEAMLTQSGKLDVTAAFVSAGLGSIAGVPAAPAATPSPTPSPPPPQANPRLPKPQLTVRMTRSGGKRVLVARVSNRPRGARLTVRVYVRRNGGRFRRVASRTRASATISIRRSTWHRATARFTDPSSRRPASPTATVNRKR